MTNFEDGRLKMYFKVKIQGENYRSKFNEIPGIEPYIPKFDSNTLKISELSGIQRTMNLGVTATKNEIRQKLCKTTAMICCSGLLLSEITRDAPFKQQINYSESALVSFSDIKLIDIAGNVNREATKKKTAMAKYGLSDLTLDVQNELISQFSGVVVNPQSIVDDRKAITQSIKNLFKENDEILNLIDIGINFIKDKYPEVYTSYKSARKITITNKRILSLRALILDSVTLEGLKNVKVAITPNASQTWLTPEEVKKNTLEKATGEKGIFNVKTIAEGVYDLVITKVGYKMATMSITIAEGEMYDLKVSLVKEG